ncbi:O-antigen ligase family protein [Methylopila turkensis]|uniref:Ligase n=1 Tax=Methylopila turkensis TaxID=1437816 RepID=A0A9W6N901_9HYPH|nr:O-antigen ligase family protein [Methylopila turkensis]GLK81896.1 ligase [Methylopila turkensis]
MVDAPMTATQADRAHALAGWRDRLHAALLYAFLFYVLIGAQPFADPSAAQRVEGNVVDRFGVLALFGLALIVLWTNRRAIPGMILPGLGLATIVGICLASLLWSDFPALTARRSLLLFFLTTIAFACAAGLPSLRRLHTAMFVACAVVIALNLVGTALLPGIAITELGVRGMYSQKNVAGIASMVAVIVTVTWMLGARRGRDVAIGLAALMPALLFLMLTRSKTSIALTALALAVVAAFALSERLGARFVLLLVGVGLLGLVGVLVLFAAYDFDLAQFSALFTGDASFTGRDELWAFALGAAQERPWLGHGYGAFWDVGADNDPLNRLDPGTWLGDVEVGTINQAHNGYLELWLHIGLPATALASLVVVGHLLRGTRWAVSALPRPERAAAGAFGLILLIYLLHNLTEATLFVRGIPFCNIAILCMAGLTRARSFAIAKTPVG